MTFGSGPGLSALPPETLHPFDYTSEIRLTTALQVRPAQNRITGRPATRHGLWFDGTALNSATSTGRREKMPALPAPDYFEACIPGMATSGFSTATFCR